MSDNTSTSTETSTEIMRESSTNDSDLITAGGANVNYIFVAFAVVTMSIAIVCNVIVFIVTAKTPKLHCISNALVSSLAVTDFARAAACMPLSIALQIDTAPPGFDTTFGMCSVYQTLFVSLGFVSTLSLAIISVERVFMIARPLVYQRVVTNHRAAVTIMTLWLAGFSYGWLQVMSFHGPALSLASMREQIRCNYVPSLELGSVDFVLTFLIPLTMMATAYAKIFMIVQSQMRRIHSTISGTIPSCWYSRSSACHKDSVGDHLSGIQIHGAIPRNIETCANAVACKRRAISDTYNSKRANKNTGSQPETSHNDTHQGTTEMNRGIFRVGTLTQDESTGDSRHPNNTDHAANDLPLADVGQLAKQLAPAVQVTFYDGNVTKICNEAIDAELHQQYSNYGISPKAPTNYTMTPFTRDAHRSISQKFGTIALKRSSIDIVNANGEQCIHADPRLSRRSTTCSRRSTIAVATITSKHRSSISQLLDNKATKMVAIVIGTFLLCWMPYKVVNLVASLCDTCVDDRSLTAVHMITYVSSAANPFIYSFYSGEFRMAFRRVLWNRATRRVLPQ